MSVSKAEMLAYLIDKGRITIDQVAETYKSEVQALLNTATES